MSKPIYLICLFFLLCSGSLFAEEPEPEQYEFNLIQTISLEMIVPQHEKFSQTVAAISSALVSFCHQKNEKNYLSSQGAWKESMLAWSSLSAINFGPIDSLNISWRFQFWPDPLNLVARKFNSRLSGRNKANTQDNLASASNAIQGLGALEFLLFDEQVAGVESYRAQAHLCGIALATTHNLLDYSKVLLASWQEVVNQREQRDVNSNEKTSNFKRELERLYSGWVMSLGAISKTKLAGPLGLDANLKKDSESFKPWLLESWRSQHSIQNIEATLQAAKRLYEAKNGFSWYLSQKSPGSKKLDKKIRHLFRKGLKRLSHISLSASALINLETTGQLIALNEEVATLYLILKLDYSKAANINFRFNAHDGD